MKRPVLEPGLLQVFRLVVAVRLGVLVLMQYSQLLRPEQRVLRFPLPGIIETTFLLGYLSWACLRERLDRLYLPLALLVASTAPIIEHDLSIILRLRAGVGRMALNTDAWQLFLVLFIPLVLIGWQYHFKAVWAFCIGSAALELALAIPLTLAGGPRWVSVLSLVFVRTTLFTLVGYLVVRLMAAQRAQHAALARANAQLARYATTLEQLAVSRERNRLARELHDTLAHTLSGVAVQLEAASALWDSDAAAARSMLEQSLQATRTGLQEARRAIQSLRAAPLEDLGLTLAVRRLAESAAARAGLELDFRGPEQVNGLTPEVEQGIYRVADEALLNVARHAHARRLSVRLDPSPGRLTLTIADDGRGFDPHSVPSAAHYGLRGMHERAEMMGGALEIASRPGHGTTVRLTVERGV